MNKTEVIFQKDFLCYSLCQNLGPMMSTVTRAIQDEDCLLRLQNTHCVVPGKKKKNLIANKK